MPNVSEINQELVRAFNINLCKNDIVMTNLTVQNLHRNFHKEDHIVISFDKSMGADQCMKYLNDMKEKIVEEFCEDESSASMSFNISFFPFKFSKKQLNKDSKGRYKFSVPIDKDVIFNLKCCLAHVLAKDIKVNIGHEFGIGYAEENTGYVSFDRKSYLYCMRFNDWKLKVRFINLLSSKIARYGNVPMDYLEIIDNRVYIEKSIFDNVEFIKNIVKDKASLICRDFEIPSAEDEVVEGLKFSIIDFIRRVGIPVEFVLRSSYLGNHENSILVPIAKDGNVDRFLTRKEVNNINNIFDINILRDIEGCTSPQHLPVFGRRGIYGIDFANQEISYCVLNKIMENSVINKDHELSIDPELRLQALSPAQSPLNSPTHAGPSGLRTPPNQRKADTDSGYDSNSPPKPKDSVAHSPSGGPGPSTELSDMEWESPTRSQDGALEHSPRRGSEQGSETEKEGRLLHNHVNSAGTSKGSWSSTQLSFPTVSQGVPGPSKGGNLGAAAASGSIPGSSLWSQSEPSSWPSPPPAHENKRTSSMQFTKPGPSGLSWSSPPPAHENKRTSSMQFTKPGPSGLSWSSPPPAHENKWMPLPQPTQLRPIGLSWTQSSSGPLSSLPPPLIPISGSVPGSRLPVSFTSTQDPDLLPPPPPLIPISGGSVPGSQPPVGRSLSSRGAQAGANISEEEKKLIKALLYTLNLTNYTSDGVYTNFFAKDGKIVSLLHDTVDREEYLQEVRDYIIEEYCEDEEEARKLYDLDEFPFKFFPDPDYEKNQNDYEPKKTVVANISSGALSNLKTLFSQKLGKNVDAIDINWVKDVKEREKNEWVDYQLSNGDSLEKACEGCFPDEEPMKIIPVAFEGGEYVLDRIRAKCEVELLFREQSRRFRGTLVNEEEKELFKALLYAFNYSNNNFDCPDTNFTVKNGKIASLIGDSVNVKEYLQEVKDKTKKEYCKDKKEAYDLNEFPFEFLSNCEKNQKMTVVANISRDALFNLKKLFIYGYKKKVKIGNTDIKIGDININIVEEEVKSKKGELVDSKLKGIEREGRYYSKIKPNEAATASYPDESALEYILIEKYEAGYYLERTYKPLETELFVKDLGYTEDRSKAGKVKSEDNKDSGISSGEATDAENVSSKADAITSSGYESMDYENPRGKSPKRKSPWSKDEGSPTRKSSRSGSNNSSSEESLPGFDRGNNGRGSQKRKSQSPVGEGNPRKSQKRDSSPLPRLESLSLSNPFDQIDKY